MLEYLRSFLVLILRTLLSFVLLMVSFLTSSRSLDVEKRSAYECGFDPFEKMGQPFEVRFYLVAILFLIFDLEISFLFPWRIVFQDLPMSRFWSMTLFLLLLTVGFYIEWVEGALDWE